MDSSTEEGGRMLCSDGDDDGGVEYNPKHFLRCHSKMKEDNADIKTMVWQCAFEPHSEYPEKTTSRVATCGANSICVIDVKTGIVKTKHYSKDPEENFYTVAWSTVGKPNDKFNVLAAAGKRSTLHLMHPKENVCFLEQTFKISRKTLRINALKFHPVARSVLFGGFEDGQVYVWDIGVPSSPDYVMELKTLHTLSISCEIFGLSFSRHCDMLLAATNSGVVSWSMSAKEVNSPKLELKTWKFTFPTDYVKDADESQLVDSVETIGNGKVIASKCALHGAIYLWDLEKAAKVTGAVEVLPDYILRWSKTDNYFMSMGSHMMSSLLACGDDGGQLWLYDIAEILSQSSKEHDPSAIIPWPEVHDVGAESKRKLKLGVYDIVVNHVAVDSTGQYIVAVTSTNLVCIWKRD